MAENNKIYITANELAEMLGVSVVNFLQYLKFVHSIIGEYM